MPYKNHVIQFFADAQRHILAKTGVVLHENMEISRIFGSDWKPYNPLIFTEDSNEAVHRTRVEALPLTEMGLMAAAQSMGRLQSQSADERYALAQDLATQGQPETFVQKIKNNIQASFQAIEDEISESMRDFGAFLILSPILKEDADYADVFETQYANMLRTLRKNPERIPLKYRTLDSARHIDIEKSIEKMQKEIKPENKYETVSKLALEIVDGIICTELVKNLQRLHANEISTLNDLFNNQFLSVIIESLNIEHKPLSTLGASFIDLQNMITSHHDFFQYGLSDAYYTNFIKMTTDTWYRKFVFATDKDSTPVEHAKHAVTEGLVSQFNKDFIENADNDPTQSLEAVEGVIAAAPALSTNADQNVQAYQRVFKYVYALSRAEAIINQTRMVDALIFPPGDLKNPKIAVLRLISEIMHTLTDQAARLRDEIDLDLHPDQMYKSIDRILNICDCAKKLADVQVALLTTPSKNDMLTQVSQNLHTFLAKDRELRSTSLRSTMGAALSQKLTGKKSPSLFTSNIDAQITPYIVQLEKILTPPPGAASSSASERRYSIFTREKARSENPPKPDADDSRDRAKSSHAAGPSTPKKPG